MAGLVPAIRVFRSTKQVVDARVKPGHDERRERHCEERSDEAIQLALLRQSWIASLRSQ